MSGSFYYPDKLRNFYLTDTNHHLFFKEINIFTTKEADYLGLILYLSEVKQHSNSYIARRFRSTES
jgi:hypothetical protein